MASEPINLAVLDDYSNLSAQFFSKVHPDRVKITYFPDTLHPNHNEADKKALIDRLQPFQVISSMRERTPFPAEILKALPNLQLLLTTGKRNAAIDLNAAKEAGIIVAGTDPHHDLAPLPNGRVKPDSTTTHTWALILGLARHVARDDHLIKTGGWQGPSLATATAGKTLALVGLGRLGLAVARIAILGFGLRVIAWSTSLTQEKADESARSIGLVPGELEVVSKEDLFKRADVLSVHYVLSARSRGIVGKDDLALLKPSALLINTSRGPVVDEEALFEVLEKGKIRGAALDVFDQEPLPKDSKWRSTKWGEDGRADVLLSPHMGYGETENLSGWYEENAANLKRWIDGEDVTTRLN